MATRLSDAHFRIRTLMNIEGARYESARVDVVLDAAQQGRFGELLGSLTQYQPGRPVALVSPQLTTRVTMELQPWQTEATITASNAGSVLKPARMAYPMRLTARYPQGEDMPDIVSGVEVVTDQHWDYRTSADNLLSPPTKTKPVARVTPTGWTVVPTPSTATVAFYRFPTPPKLAFQRDATTGDILLDDETGEPIPDDANTVDAEWLPLSDTEIIRRACEMLGLRTGDRPAQEFARATAQQPS